MLKKERSGASSLGCVTRPHGSVQSVESRICQGAQLFQYNGSIVGKRQKARGKIRQRDLFTRQWTTSLDLTKPFMAAQAQNEGVFVTQRRVLTRSPTIKNEVEPWSHPFNYLADSKLKLFKIIIINNSSSLCSEQYLSSKINNFSIIKEK